MLLWPHSAASTQMRVLTSRSIICGVPQRSACWKPFRKGDCARRHRGCGLCSDWRKRWTGDQLGGGDSAQFGAGTAGERFRQRLSRSDPGGYRRVLQNGCDRSVPVQCKDGTTQRYRNAMGQPGTRNSIGVSAVSEAVSVQCTGLVRIARRGGRRPLGTGGVASRTSIRK